jgi:hypothetical protein
MEEADAHVFIVEAATLRKEIDALRAEVDKMKAEVSTRDAFIDKLLDVLKARDAPRVTLPPTFPPTPPTFYPYKTPPTVGGSGGSISTPSKDLKTARGDPAGYA